MSNLINIIFIFFLFSTITSLYYKEKYSLILSYITLFIFSYNNNVSNMFLLGNGFLISIIVFGENFLSHKKNEKKSLSFFLIMTFASISGIIIDIHLNTYVFVALNPLITISCIFILKKSKKINFLIIDFFRYSIVFSIIEYFVFLSR